MKKILILGLGLFFPFIQAQVTLTKDVSFGNNGVVNLNINSGFITDYYFSSNNKLTIAITENTSTNPSNTNWFSTYVRLDNNGNVLHQSNTNFYSYDKILYADNNFYYICSFNSNIYKYFSNGDPDLSFANNGVLNIEPAFDTCIHDNKIFVRKSNKIIRYTSSGNLDIAYGINGEVSTTFNPDSNKSFFTGFGDYLFEYSDNHIGINKININTGTLNLFYGNNGSSIISNFPVELTSHMMNSNSEIINLMRSDQNIFDYYLSKTKADGNLDTTFSSAGLLNLPEILNNKNLSYDLTYHFSTYNDYIFVPTAIISNNPAINYANAILCYSLITGNLISINGENLFESGENTFGMGNYSIEIKGNYLYLFTANTISRYLINEGLLNTKETITKEQANFNNPFKEQLTVNNAEEVIKEIEISDANGRQILMGKNTNSINTSTLAKGVYFIKITTESNKAILKKGIKN